MEKINNERKARLIRRLTPTQITGLEENCAFLSRRWMSVLPTHKALRMDDLDVSTALSIRMLDYLDDPSLTTCRHCNRPYYWGHEDVCAARVRVTTLKHDSIVRILHAAIRSVPGNTSIMEPNPNTLPGESSRKPDIKVSNANGTHYYDVTVISLGAQTRNSNARNTLTTAENDKIRKHADLGRNFRPFVISQGGLLSQKTSTWYKEIQGKLTLAGAGKMDLLILLTLARFRARCWNRYGIAD